MLLVSSIYWVTNLQKYRWGFLPPVLAPLGPCWVELHDKEEPRPQLWSVPTLLRWWEDKFYQPQQELLSSHLQQLWEAHSTTNGAFFLAWGYRGTGEACSQLSLLSCPSCRTRAGPSLQSITHRGCAHGSALGMAKKRIPLPKDSKAERFWLGCSKQGSD